MTHKPPVPDSAVSPYPLRAAETAERDGVLQELADRSAGNLKADPSRKTVRIAAGAAIGSAAVAAALLFWNRSRPS